jgi:predicted kinase
MPAFSSLQQKFDELLRTPDVVVMAASDAMVSARKGVMRLGTHYAMCHSAVQLPTPAPWLEPHLLQR